VSDEELIDGVYKLVMCIATGGSSQVWECVEQAGGRHLAMKLLKQDSPDFKENKAGLKHEAEVLKSLDHPLIIKFDKFSSSRDNTYMVMEHFRAPNVKLQLKADMRSVHIRARKLFESVCQALAHVHSRGWVHRDIKPDNVLMNKAGEIRLVDFSLSSKEVKGFAKMMGGGKLKTIQGTRTYIAPETIRKQTPTFQTDLYSLGILFFEVLTGRTPFQAPTPEELLMRHLRDEPANASEFNSNVSPDMDRLIAKLLKKKPADRPASVEEVLGELRRIRIFKEDVTEAAQSDDADPSMESLTDIRLDSRADAKLSVMLQANPELARQLAEDRKNKSAAKKAQAEIVRARAQKSNDQEAARVAAKGKGPAAAPAPAPVPMYPPQAPYPQYPPMMPGMPPGMMPGMPPGAMPGMPPGAMPPGMMPGMPGMPAPGQAIPGMPMPGYPLPPTGFGPPGVGIPMPPPTIPVPVTPSSAPPVPAAGTQPSRPAPQAPVPPAAAGPARSAPPATSVPAKPAAPARPAPPSPPPNPDELDFMTELPDVL